MHSLEITKLPIEGQSEIDNNELVKVFLSAKRIEGCSEKTLKYYEMIIMKMTEQINRPIRETTTEHLRLYLANYQNERNSSKVTIDNMRRIFSSFFG